MNHLSTQEVGVFDRVIARYDKTDVIDAHPDHADYLADKLREIDVIECMAFGKKPKEALMSAFDYDRATMTVVDKANKPLAMFGVGESADLQTPYVWMLGSKEFPKVARRDLIKHSKTWIRELLKITGGTAENVVHCYNRPAVRWLEWLGANFTHELKIKGEPFYKFILINHEVIDEYYV